MEEDTTRIFRKILTPKTIIKTRIKRKDRKRSEKGVVASPESTTLSPYKKQKSTWNRQNKRSSEMWVDKTARSSFPARSTFDFDADPLQLMGGDAVRIVRSYYELK